MLIRKASWAGIRFRVEITFRMMEGSIRRADLDNLAKPILDTLYRVRYPQVRDLSLTGALFDVDDEQVYVLALQKESVPSAAEEGVEITIHWEDATEQADKREWLGIDFSGFDKQWAAGRGKSNVWLSCIKYEAGRLRLKTLRSIQELDGDGPPFIRLQNLLLSGEFEAAAIDAPFSIPATYLPPGGHSALLKLVDLLPSPGRPFPKGGDFVARVVEVAGPLASTKPFRECEQHWRNQGLNPFSTLWAKSRGGAAMTAACLKLLANAKRPIWPWADVKTPGLLVEAYPAAQLFSWGWPHYGYSKPEQQSIRERIVERLESLIEIDGSRNKLVSNPDALDSVLAAFAGLAVTSGSVWIPPAPVARGEGWIAVHAPVPTSSEETNPRPQVSPVPKHVQTPSVAHADSVRRLYTLLSGLSRFAWEMQDATLPLNGLYLMYEHGEEVEMEGSTLDRVVRVGINRAQNTFRRRMQRHKLGNRRTSILRAHLGGALLSKSKTTELIELWRNRKGVPLANVEEQISDYLHGNISFQCIRVDDQRERHSLEAAVIALLSRHRVGEASPDWLGRLALSERIRSSGLWNVHHIYSEPATEEQLTRLEELTRLPLID